MTFNGIDPRTLHPGISIAKEIPPGAPASKVETVVSGTGEILAGRTLSQTTYTVRVNLAGRNIRQGWEMRQILADWARPTDKTARRLVPTHWPTVYYDAVCKEIDSVELSRGFATVEVVFLLLRPIAKSIRTSTAAPSAGETTTTVRIGGTHYARPDISMADLSAGTSGLVLYVDGVPLLKLSGAVTAGSTIDLIAGDRPMLTQTMPSGEAEDITSRIAYAETDFGALWSAFSPGRHEVRTVPTSKIRLTWRDEWV